MNIHKYRCFKGTAVAQWSRCCVTNRKAAGSIPAGVSGFFIDIKSLRSHYGPGVDSASNRNKHQGKGGRCVRLTTYHHPVLLSRNLGALTSWNPLDLSRPVMGLLYFFTGVSNCTVYFQTVDNALYKALRCYYKMFYIILNYPNSSLNLREKERFTAEL